MIEVDRFEEVTRIKMSIEAYGKPVYWTTAYLVDGLLVDTGCAHTAEELVDFLEGEELELVVNTHFHEDHIGANRLIQQRFGVKIFAHRDSVPLINREAKLYPYQEYVWGCPEPSLVSELAESVQTRNHRFDLIETEGHCAGHVTLVEMDRGWCFSGDIFISDRPKVIRNDEDASGLIESLRKLLALPTYRLVLFTSMGRIIPEGRKALKLCADYLEETAIRVKALAAQGHSIEAIRQELFGEGSSLATLTGGHFSTENLVESLLAVP